MKHKVVVLLCSISFMAQGQQLGALDGSIVDRTGAAIIGAHLRLSLDTGAPEQETVSGNEGHFTFNNVAPGAFHLSISADSFATQASSGFLKPGESLNLPQITMELATLNTNVQVTLTQTEIAEEQLKAEERQRLLGFIPNFDINYLPNAAPLNSKQKFELAGKTAFDPITFVINGAIAGFQQSQNDYRGFGQGTEGYAKRYSASYASFLTGTVISSALLPSLLKQDPRYFYKGTGSHRSRFLYAISRSVIRQGDNGRPQFDYSGVLGDLAAAGISRFYYPAKNRDSAGVTFENALIGIGGQAAGHLFDEFLSRRLTTKKPKTTSP